MPKYTAYVVVAFAREITTGKSEAFMRFGKYVSFEAAERDLGEAAKEKLSVATHTDRWIILNPMPRQFFEEVLADMGNLDELAGTEDPIMVDQPATVEWPDELNDEQ